MIEKIVEGEKFQEQYLFSSKQWASKNTDVYLACIVRFIIGHLDLLKTNHLFLELLRREGSIGMTVKTVGRSGVSLASHQPGWPVIGVSVSLIVTRDNVQQDQVLGARLQVKVGEAAADGGEHPPPGPRDDHLCPKLTKLVPKVLVVKIAFDVIQVRAVWFPGH